ncbi:hypothetical protein TgHK011_002070 [Trichoderma gracile]|nr:hypothetical protein TgHK011_002070 [Trichoderma gracile]
MRGSRLTGTRAKELQAPGSIALVPAARLGLFFFLLLPWHPGLPSYALSGHASAELARSLIAHRSTPRAGSSADPAESNRQWHLFVEPEARARRDQTDPSLISP